mmetsp:Transcript_17603/g.48653  ORF Transcript_17603/g.48653 Transcript_17603/m.48653 type:complete len:254 (+) Transcript_17603:3386-4147(+)
MFQTDSPEVIVSGREIQSSRNVFQRLPILQSICCNILLGVVHKMVSFIAVCCCCGKRKEISKQFVYRVSGIGKGLRVPGKLSADLESYRLSTYATGTIIIAKIGIPNRISQSIPRTRKRRASSYDEHDRRPNDHHSLPRRFPPPLPRWSAHRIRPETRIPSIPSMSDDAESEASRHHCRACPGIQGAHHGLSCRERARSSVLPTPHDALSHRQYRTGRNPKGCRTEKLRRDSHYHRLQVLSRGCHDQLRPRCL